MHAKCLEIEQTDLFFCLQGFLDEVEVHLKEPCEEWPYFEMDESCKSYHIFAKKNVYLFYC